MFDFNRIKLVAKREMTTRFKQKAYRWTLIIQVIVALGAGFAPILMSYFMDDVVGGKVIVVDEANVGFADRMQANMGEDIPGLTPLTIVNSTDGADAAGESVKDGDADVAVIVTESDGAFAYELVTEDGDASGLTAQRVQAAIYSSNVALTAEREGVSEDQAEALVGMPVFSVEDPGGESSSIADNFSGPKFSIVNIGLVLMYIMFMMYGTWISQGVVEEKQSRMMEIMLNAATPRDLLVGKVLGVLGAGLVQMVPMLLAGALSFALQPRIADALDIDLGTTFDFDLAAVSFQAIAVFLVYFVLGYFLFGAIFAAAGSMVSRQEEVSSAMGPAIMLIVIGLMLAYVVMAIPNSLAAKIMFIVPITSPFVSLARVMLGDPGALEIAVSVVVLAISAVLAMWGAAAIYRTGVLMYGQKGGLLHFFRNRTNHQVAR